MQPCSKSNYHISLSVFLLIFGHLLQNLQAIPERFAQPIDWDLIVSHGNRMMLMSLNSNSSNDLVVPHPWENLQKSSAGTGHNNNNNNKDDNENLDWEGRKIVSVAFDGDRNLLYFNKIIRNKPAIVAYYDLQLNYTKILHQSFNSQIVSLAYHDHYLYWPVEHRIFRLNMNTSITINDNSNISSSINDNSSFSDPEPFFIREKKMRIRGIAISTSHKIIYWTIWAPSSSSPSTIEYSHLDNSSQNGVLVPDAYMPSGLSVDGDYLYWTDNLPGIHFTIERILLSKDSESVMQRQVLFRGQHQSPYSIVVFCAQKLLWTDTDGNQLEEIQIENLHLQSQSSSSIIKSESGPTPTSKIIKKYEETPYSIVSRKIDQIPNSQLCKSLEDLEKMHMPKKSYFEEQKTTKPIGISTSSSSSFSSTSSSDFSTTSTTFKAEKNENEIPTSNSKLSGTFIDNNNNNNNNNIDEIENKSQFAPLSSYHAIAKLNANLNTNAKEGLITLQRCEESNYCSNGALCLSHDGNNYCLCSSSYTGPKCEELNLDTRNTLNSNKKSPAKEKSFVYIAIISILISIIFILLIVIAFLTVKVCRLKQIPKIRRRVILSRNSSENAGSSTAVCEMIDIENCCNMNICETPCYERHSSFSGSSSNYRNKIKSSNKEDKKRLIDS